MELVVRTLFAVKDTKHLGFNGTFVERQQCKVNGAEGDIL